MWIFFLQNHLGHQNRFKIHIRGCKWLRYQYKLILFYPYHIIEALFSRLNLRFSQKNYSYLIFLTKVHSSPPSVFLAYSLPFHAWRFPWIARAKKIQHRYFCLRLKILKSISDNLLSKKIFSKSSTPFKEQLVLFCFSKNVRRFSLVRIALNDGPF